MDFIHSTTFEKRKKGEALVIPFWNGTKQAEIASPVPKDILDSLSTILESKDFLGKEGDVLVSYHSNLPEKRCILVGLGEEKKLTTEQLRKSYGSFLKSILPRKISSLNVLIPSQKTLSDDELIRGITEGLLLPNYVFNQLKGHTSQEDSLALVDQIQWIGSQKNVIEIAEKYSLIAEAVYYARDLVNGNADDVTPQKLALCAKGLSKEFESIKTTIFDKKRLEKEGLNLILAVGRGSHIEPVMIIMEYKGNPKSKDHTIIVGKGVTYDTGGLNLKPTGSMETMKCDMAGAAACLGTIMAAAELKLNINLTAVVPATENGIDAASFKPGDVYKSYSGKTVEMLNSDAEGRLILADALAYSIKNLKPSRIIDLATLTGAIDIALGSEASGLMSTDDTLAQQLVKAGESTQERLWRMPLYDEYKEKLKSDLADLKSIGGRSGGANVAATFLRHFIDETIPWAHLDIASTAYVTEPKKYQTKYATGVGVRLLVDLLEGYQERKGKK